MSAHAKPSGPEGEEAQALRERDTVGRSVRGSDLVRRSGGLARREGATRPPPKSDAEPNDIGVQNDFAGRGGHARANPALAFARAHAEAGISPSFGIAGQSGLDGERPRHDKKEEALLTSRQWQLYVQRASAAGLRTRDAILPCWNDWMDREHGGVAFHMTQLLSVHGCFASYLYRIGKKATSLCEHCTANMEDTTEHTLQDCEKWSVEREELARVVGRDLSLGAVVRAISGNADAWKALSRFAGRVMLKKDQVERERQTREASILPPSDGDESTPGGVRSIGMVQRTDNLDDSLWMPSIS